MARTTARRRTARTFRDAATIITMSPLTAKTHVNRTMAKPIPRLAGAGHRTH
jgi:hypothetical protein